MLNARSLLPRLSLHVLVVALVAAGIVHITSTLAIPFMSSSTGYERLAAGIPINAMRVLPLATPGAELLPFNDPELQLAVCPFDLSVGPLTVNAVLPEAGWSLAIYSQLGDNYYAIAAATLRQPDVTLVLEPTKATLLNLFGIGMAPNFDASRVAAPESRGIVVIRAPRKGQAFEQTTAAMLARASCRSGPVSG